MFIVFNAGSSSLKIGAFESAGESMACRFRGHVEGFGPRASVVFTTVHDENGSATEAIGDHAAAAARLLSACTSDLRAITAIGHRVVHGGRRFSELTPLDEDAIAALDELSVLAPLHNPPAVAVIRAVNTLVGPGVASYAAFDTAFHHRLPEPAATYAIPLRWREDYGVRRYGFHGIAHAYLFDRYIALSGKDSASARVVSFQLGHGCSAAAVTGGRSVDTSMGFTPIEGLVMGARPGDLDPGALTYMGDAGGLSVAEIEHTLNHECGLRGLSGSSDDMRDLERLAGEGDREAALAIDVFCYRARKYLGAYLAVLNGADAVVFGGGIGEHAAAIRAAICEEFEWCGLVLDADANRNALGTQALISDPKSTIDVYVIPVDEERAIAEQIRALTGGRVDSDGRL